MKLTDHFSLEEFLKSDSHPELMDELVLTQDQTKKLFYLCEFALEPIRAKFGPTRITSGFRTLALNDAIGGSKTSQHLLAEAADFMCSGVKTMQEVYHWADKSWPGELFFYVKAGHCHISLPILGKKSDHKIFEDK
jgi:zinc D-Ala-D-Ala carboxypeptidase